MRKYCGLKRATARQKPVKAEKKRDNKMMLKTNDDDDGMMMMTMKMKKPL